LLNRINETANGFEKLELTPFKHPWAQSSIIARIPGKSERTVVIGAHQDSINLFLPSLLAAPGADDDGSGTVTTLEAFRVLVEHLKSSGEVLEQTVEFHWYSAEEGGLLGSQAIFSSYEKEGKDVVAMLQQVGSPRSDGARVVLTKIGHDWIRGEDSRCWQVRECGRYHGLRR
jgi:leucyl aminopeptidase